MALSTFKQVAQWLKDYKEDAGTSEAVKLLKTVGLKRLYELKNKTPDQISAFGVMVQKAHALWTHTQTAKRYYQGGGVSSSVPPILREGEILMTGATISGLSFVSDSFKLVPRLEFAELSGRMASVQKVISKIDRWGLDSVEPREGHPDHNKTNRAIMLGHLDTLRTLIGSAEEALAHDLLSLDRDLAGNLERSLADLKNTKGVQTVLSVIREIGQTDDVAKLLSNPAAARAVIERADALVQHHHQAATPKKPASPFEDEDDGFD